MKTVRKLPEIVAIQTMLYTVKRVRDSDHCLTQSEQIYHGENKLHSMGWWWCPLCTKPTRL